MSFSNTETRGKVMAFDQLGVFTGVNDSLSSPLPKTPNKTVSFKTNEKVSPSGKVGNDSFASQSYSDADFEDEEGDANDKNKESIDSSGSGSTRRSSPGKLPKLETSPNHGKVMTFDMLEDVITAPAASVPPLAPPKVQAVATTPVKQTTQIATR